MIQSRSHSIIQKIRLIRDGKEPSLIFCEGFKVVEELLKSPEVRLLEIYSVNDLTGKVEDLLKRHQKQSLPVTLLSKPVMDFVSDVDTAPGVIAIAKKPIYKESPAATDEYERPFFLIIHRVQLPQNLGSLLRTAEAAGVSEVWLSENTADPYSPKAIRGSSGSVFRMKLKTGIKLFNEVKLLEKKGVHVYAATQHGSKLYDEVPWRDATALVLGSEGAGFSKGDLELFDETIRIPMQGETESLNVGIAAAVCLFEAARQRRVYDSK